VLARAKADARARARGRSAGRRGDGSAPATEGGTDSDGGRPGDRQPPGRSRLPGIAAPGRDWREPVSFAAALGRLVADRGWRARAMDASVLARWDVLVGPDIAAHCTPVSLRDGELELAAESTAWATQLRMLSRQLLATLRKELGPDVVRKITVRGPTAPSWRHGPLRAPGGRGPRDTYG
jgi:predicted nucleic acid-binding Zn ribbon protein